ncbi:MAG: Gfo/Idh/MocA family oxidoreductase [Oscillospiraceae bacterium]|nr:Gfo/Idh/MocA family oxidoreductase [Oscillospiraceae bacterium]
MSEIKAGIIGTGGISVCHLEGYNAIPDVKVVACCDIDFEKAKKYAEKYSIPNVYADCKEMMEKEELDVVSVTTWNAAHKECTITALKGGANVICEKPMAMNAAEAEEMMKTAEECGKLLQIGFVRRFGKDAAIFKEFSDDGVLGDIYYAKATYLRRSGCPGGWFGNKAISGGGPLIDLGVHVIDLSRYLAGNPKPVSVSGVTYSNLGKNRALGAEVAWDMENKKRDEEIYNVEDFVSAMVRFENGFTLSVEASFNLNCKSDSGEIQLFGTKGGAALTPKLEIYTDVAGRFVNIQPAVDVGFSMDAFNDEMKGFVDAAMRGKPCRATAEDGVMLMKIIDGIYRSAETGREVVL